MSDNSRDIDSGHARSKRRAPLDEMGFRGAGPEPLGERLGAGFEAMLKSLAAPAFVCAGARHEILDCNEPLADLFGYRREELLGVSVTIFGAWTEEGARRRFPAMDGIIQAGSPHHVLPGRARSGRVFFCSFDCVGLRDEVGDLVATFCLVRDLSRECARESALCRIADSLASLSRELERITAPFDGDPVSRVEDFSLTPRQLEVFRLVSEGLSSKEIGARLGIAESTVKNHLAAAFERVGVTSRMELVRKLADRGT